MKIKLWSDSKKAVTHGLKGKNLRKYGDNIKTKK